MIKTLLKKIDYYLKFGSLVFTENELNKIKQFIETENKPEPVYKKILDKIDSKIHDVEFLDDSMSKLYWKADLEEIKQLVRAKIDVWVKCPDCNGTGRSESNYTHCHPCFGSGTVKQLIIAEEKPESAWEMFRRLDMNNLFREKLKLYYNEKDYKIAVFSLLVYEPKQQAKNIMKEIEKE